MKKLKTITKEAIGDMPNVYVNAFLLRQTHVSIQSETTLEEIALALFRKEHVRKYFKRVSRFKKNDLEWALQTE